MITEIDKLIGKNILHIFMNEDYLKFETDQGNVVFGVEGDCCSHSYFHDFIGVKKLLENGPVVSVSQISLEPTEFSKSDKEALDSGELKVYGFSIVTEHQKFGEQTSVFSFRNSSNGYYGGNLCDANDDTQVSPEITDDVTEVNK